VSVNPAFTAHYSEMGEMPTCGGMTMNPKKQILGFKYDSEAPNKMNFKFGL
jgi:hypothetical protein